MAQSPSRMPFARLNQLQQGLIAKFLEQAVAIDEEALQGESVRRLEPLHEFRPCFSECRPGEPLRSQLPDRK